MNLASAWSEAVEFRPVPLSSDSSGLRQIFCGRLGARPIAGRSTWSPACRDTTAAIGLSGASTR